jgi:hypothetical protein
MRERTGSRAFLPAASRLFSDRSSDRILVNSVPASPKRVSFLQGKEGRRQSWAGKGFRFEVGGSGGRSGQGLWVQEGLGFRVSGLGFRVGLGLDTL